MGDDLPISSYRRSTYSEWDYMNHGEYDPEKEDEKFSNAINLGLIIVAVGSGLIYLFFKFYK